MQQKALAILCIVCGIILIVLSLPVLMHIALLIVGLYAINYGLRLMRKPTLWQMLQVLFFRSRF